MWTEFNLNTKHHIAECDGKAFVQANRSPGLSVKVKTEHFTPQAHGALYLTTILNHFKYAI